MNAYRNTGDFAPLTWIGRHPVHVSTVLAALHALTMVLTAVAMAAGAEAFLQALVFSSNGFLHGLALWQPVTYAFVHLPPYWMFLIELYLLVAFGTEIERHLGHKAFFRLYLVLLLLPPVLLSAAGLLGFSSMDKGSGALHFGIFVAFAVLYPSAEIFFSVQARWVVIALLVVNSLQCLALSDFVSLGVLLVDSAAAYVIVRHMRHGDIRPVRAIAEWMASFQKPRLRVVPREKANGGIDAILEKISRSGLGSLTPRERARLQREREELIAKDGKF